MKRRAKIKAAKWKVRFAKARFLEAASEFKLDRMKYFRAELLMAEEDLAKLKNKPQK